MNIVPFTVREWFLLVLVLVEFALLLFAIHRVQKINQSLKEERNKQKRLPIKIAEICEKCKVNPVMEKDGKVYNLCGECWGKICMDTEN
jgi:hypothetical protein